MLHHAIMVGAAPPMDGDRPGVGAAVLRPAAEEGPRVTVVNDGTAGIPAGTSVILSEIEAAGGCRWYYAVAADCAPEDDRWTSS